MRRKSARTSGKPSPEKLKQVDSPARRSRRTSKRRRKSASESENSEDEQEVKQTPMEETSPNGANTKRTLSDTENNDSVIEKELLRKEEIMEKQDKKIKLKRNRTSGIHDGNETNLEDKQSSRRSRRRGSPKTEERIHQEDDDDDRKGKGKSKGKTKSAKIEKSQLPNEPETRNESDISTNAQVTPQSPQIVNTNLVDNEVDVAENAEDNKDRKNSDGDNMGDSDTKDKNIVRNELEGATNELEIQSAQSNKVVNDNADQGANLSANNQSTNCQDSSDKENPENISSSHKENAENISSSDKKNAEDICSSDKKNAEDIASSEETKSEQTAVIESEKEIETVQSEIIQAEASVENVKSDEGFAGFTKVQFQSNDTSEPAEVPMDISSDVTFTLKTDEDSLNITEAEEAIQEHQTEAPTIDTALPDDPHCSTSVQKPPEKQYIVRKLRIRRPSNAKPEGPREKGWGSTSTYLDLFSHVKIDTEIVQSIYGNVQFLDESEVKLDIVDAKDRRKSITEVKDRKRLERSVSSNDSESRKYESQSEDKEHEKDNANIIAMNRKISIVDDSASKLKPPPSPAKNPTASVLFITNLVRPFTLKQLKELLERTGRIKENCFWTDRIKSKCYVQYENVEDADATRNALHGVHWPIGNGKKLIIDFATEEDLQNAKNPPVVLPVPEIPVAVEKENQEPAKKVRDEKEDRGKEKLREKRRHEHVREWDVGKTETRKERSRSRSRTRDRVDKRKHARHSPSPFEDYLTRKQKKADDQVPQKLMDDLFQKTKTTPSIYWQPLSPEEIETKQQQRLERMAEHKRRMEESTRNSRAEFGRGAPFRRRYD